MKIPSFLEELNIVKFCSRFQISQYNFEFIQVYQNMGCVSEINYIAWVV